MALNEVFRIVSLRQSKHSPDGGEGDPRLKLAKLLNGDARDDTELRELRATHAELSTRLVQTETVQRAVIDTYMSDLLDEDAKAAAKRRGATTAIADFDRFRERVTARLSEPDAAIFKESTASIPHGLTDLASIVGRLDTAIVISRANQICAQIRAVEANGSGAPPTVSGQPSAGAKPVVAAIGWGDLVLARETLVGYEATEIAHIENVLPGETKLRAHRRISRTEEVVESESTTERESEKDSQTTDRYELQAESQQTINQQFSISNGVNTSGRYGLTHVDTTLDTAFAHSESQSRSTAVDSAREIVSKAVERTFERVRKLRRLTVTEEIRELNRHELSNLTGSPTPAAVSGMYLWVEKVLEVALRLYGTRMMVEFHVPEPALSLYGRPSTPPRRVLSPFDVSPSQVHPTNYMCLAQRYAALDVEPQPTQFIEVGHGWVSKLNEEDDAWAEDQFTATINVPDGYRPTWAKVAWSALRGENENREFNFAFSVGGRSQNIEHTVPTYDGVVLQLPGNADWPQGVPASGRVHGAWDGAMYVQVTLTCVRTAEALDRWRLDTWRALRTGYEALARELAQEQAQELYEQGFLGPVIGERPAAENRRIERTELQKWAIKSMRRVPQSFNAVAQVGDEQEISPLHADAQAPIVRFYEDAFEWEHMSYSFYPYHWARRATWRARAAAKAIDPRHQAFLEAGAAKVIVPVAPGYEDHVLAFLDPSDPTANELERILKLPPTSAPANATDQFRDLWIELLTERKPDVARGSGTLSVEHDSATVRVNGDSHWEVDKARDAGREIHVAGNRYEIASVTDATTFDLDRPCESANDPRAPYVAGSTPYGPTWTINVPTSLVILADNVPALRNV